ncbi:MAG: hypothetical protein ACI96L_000458 [Paracoccaceae bacterium]|jgi:hypothetical protein
MARSKRVKLTLRQKLNYYSIPLVLFIGSLIPVFDTILNKTNTWLPLINPFSIFSILAVAIFLLLHFKLRLIPVAIKCSSDELNEAASRAAREMHCGLKRPRQNLIRLESRDSMVIAIKTRESLLICNTFNPSYTGSKNHFNFTESIKIKRAFLTHLEKVKAAEPAPTYTQVEENQWSFKRMMMRIFVYTFFLAPIFLTAYSTDLFLIIISILCLPYIYVDTKLVLKQLRER